MAIEKTLRTDVEIVVIMLCTRIAVYYKVSNKFNAKWYFYRLINKHILDDGKECIFRKSKQSHQSSRINKIDT